MSRCTWIAVVLAGLLVAPSFAAAQQPPPVAPPGTEELSDGDGSEVGGAEVFLGAFRAIRNYHMDSYPDSVLWEMALEGLLAELEDPYAVVFTPEEFASFQEDNTGNYAGIGVTIGRLNDRITVTSVIRGAPAERVGLEVGDFIVGVSGEDARSWTVSEASDRIRGPAGSSVELEVERRGAGEPLPFTVPRERVHVSAVTAEMVADSIGYILVDRVARNSAEEVDSALARLEGARGLVVDLRRNPGGYLDEALDIADLFLDRGEVIASARSRVPGETDETREESWESGMSARLPGVPAVVLVDQYSASASEIIAGALQDHDRALVIGERTFGKGVVQTVMRIPGDRRIRLTTGSWYTPLGRSLHRPRDAQGRPLAQEVDGSTIVTTEAGREIRAGGGGIYPDLPVTPDTLSSGEQGLIRATAQSGVPLSVRIVEFAIEQARDARDSGNVVLAANDEVALLDPAAFQGFIDALVAEGVDGEILRRPAVRDYLRWRVRAQIAEGMGRTDLALAIRMERDAVLDEAVRLLEGVSTQNELFVAAEELRADDDRIETADASRPPERSGDLAR